MTRLTTLLQISLIALLTWHNTAAGQPYEMTKDELAAHYQPMYEEIANAIYLAEGGKKARVPYGILSVPVRSKAEARRVCIRTIARKHRSWRSAGNPGSFVSYLGRSYAPINAKNDPRRLNRHWVRNVEALL